MNIEYFDVLIVGAGLSGIGAACRLQRDCPDRRYVILEGRGAMGGTWDLFRYPGIRSDSDMHTLGYDFKPWKADKAIADGPAILSYMREAADENDIHQHIRYRHRVTDLAWSSSEGRWTVQAERGKHGEPVTISAGFVFMCAGYYNYDKAHAPEFTDQDRFRGQIVHPQFWPEDLDYRGKRVIVIGSGATAMTLVPAMAQAAEHVTMLQRSPTYVVSRPDRDWIANLLRRMLPESWAYNITRWKNVLAQQWVYHRTRVAPQRVRSILLDRVRGELGPDYDVEKHFTPRYNPWDQRLCLIPNSDLFAAIRDSSVTVVTDEIARLAAGGIELKSGELIAADIIVSATGLELAMLGEAQVKVDGDSVDFSSTWSYKGVMYSDVPNLITTFGYINASWTLRADLTAAYSCRLLNHMRNRGATSVVPRLRPEDAGMPERDWIEQFSAGYMRRLMHRFPRQGDREPWLNPQNYRKDRVMFLKAPLEDGVLQFSKPEATAEDAAGPVYSAAS